MADQSRKPDTTDLDPGATSGMPRWVKISLIVVVALILLIVILNFAGIGGGHGPMRHGPAPGVPGHSRP